MFFLEARAGIEPAHGGFADRCVTTSPPCHVSLSYLTYFFLSNSFCCPVFRNLSSFTASLLVLHSLTSSSIHGRFAFVERTLPALCNFILRSTFSVLPMYISAFFSLFNTYTAYFIKVLSPYGGSPEGRQTAVLLLHHWAVTPLLKDRPIVVDFSLLHRSQNQTLGYCVTYYWILHNF